MFAQSLLGQGQRFLLVSLFGQSIKPPFKINLEICIFLYYRYDYGYS
uniref:Uncharacterized protein n=1 Tax=uncultured bacterium contig00029 TaxID=1181518 RepID=A0A806KGK8_9BACT|nr:hypothetical protein [uncultured bacterium contig00029]